LAPLAVITILLGVYPKPVFDVTSPAVAKLVHDTRAAIALAHAPELAANKGVAP
jgi:NADH:ubiquinone oxidoreductase subunit 4 (subunit M)